MFPLFPVPSSAKGLHAVSQGLPPLFCPSMVNTQEPAQKQRGVIYTTADTQHTRRGGVVPPSGGGKQHVHLNVGGK